MSLQLPPRDLEADASWRRQSQPHCAQDSLAFMQKAPEDFRSPHRPRADMNSLELVRPGLGFALDLWPDREPSWGWSCSAGVAAGSGSSPPTLHALEWTLPDKATRVESCPQVPPSDLSLAAAFPGFPSAEGLCGGLAALESLPRSLLPFASKWGAPIMAGGPPQPGGPSSKRFLCLCFLRCPWPQPACHSSLKNTLKNNYP